MSRVEELEAALREARKWVEHYGEPEGLANCARNGTCYPLHEDDVTTDDKVRECDCGAGEALAKIDAALGDKQSEQA